MPRGPKATKAPPHPYSLRLPAEVWTALAERSKATNETMTDIVLDALRAHLGIKAGE